MSNYTVEDHIVIYNDDTGDSITVRPDRDGLGLIEVIQAGGLSITLTVNESKLVAEALIKLSTNG